jgi:hypothetical protein
VTESSGNGTSLTAHVRPEPPPPPPLSLWPQTTMSSADHLDIRDLFGLNPSASKLLEYLKALASIIPNGQVPDPQVKAYPDAVYFNYFALGLSILFVPTGSYKPKTGLTRSEIEDAELSLDSIDLYNVPKLSQSDSKGKSSALLDYTTFPLSPLLLSLLPGTVGDKPRPEKLEVTHTTTGKEFVAALGEPDRKGGGAGPSSGSIGIWCEWSKDGLLVELGGEEARGPQAWERGKDAVWKVLTLFEPKSASE